MDELMVEIIYSILMGSDYRTYVLATINKRFIDKVEELTRDIFKYKREGKDWITNIIEEFKRKRGKENKFKLLWFCGLNEKTVKNMTGSSKKEVILEIGKKNIEALRTLINYRNSPYEFRIIIKKDDESIELDNFESLVFLNIISTMKLTIQGGAWSEVGKKTEKALLHVIFNLLKIPEENYLLIFDEMKEKGFIENREIDAIIFNKNKEVIKIELKLLGIGNPEIGDEAIARGVDLFLVDKITDMMKIESEKKGITVIEFKKNDSLNELYEFFKRRDVPCEKPEIPEKEKIKELLKNFNYSKEKIILLKKLKELTH